MEVIIKKTNTYRESICIISLESYLKKNALTKIYRATCLSFTRGIFQCEISPNWRSFIKHQWTLHYWKWFLLLHYTKTALVSVSTATAALEQRRRRENKIAVLSGWNLYTLKTWCGIGFVHRFVSRCPTQHIQSYQRHFQSWYWHQKILIGTNTVHLTILQK